MTWPTHDAGSTTPEPGPPERDPRNQALRDQAPREPWPEPRPDDGPDSWSDDEEARHGRHPSYPDPLPPLEGPMPGGPSPAETTLPLALKWPAPPARPPRTPRFTPHPSGPAGPGGPGGPGVSGSPAGTAEA